MADHYIGKAIWTYSNDPENSDRDEVRFLSGDCIIAERYLTDAEIAYCIAKEPTNNLAAAKAAEQIAAKLAREMSQGAEGFSPSLDQRRSHFLSVGEDLRTKYGQGEPEAGGISDAANEALDDDTDAVLTPFRLGMHDHPEVIKDTTRSLIQDEDNL